MEIQAILAHYDAMFGEYSLSDIEAYLYENIEKAKELSETAALFTLLNEMIGFCRDTTQREKALYYCDELLDLLDFMNLRGTVEYATALLNIANAYRAFGLLEESIQVFENVERIYNQKLSKNDFGYANLYNNWALTYQEMKAYEKAKTCLLKALDVVDLYEDEEIKQATTRTNLAATLLQMKSQESYQEARNYLKEALAIHEKYKGQDFHYGASLVAMGDAYSYECDYENAAKYYEIGFCMWLTDEDYELFGEALQKEYDNLIASENRLKYRRGVMRIQDFYRNRVEEFQLAEATNGAVFADPLGEFSAVREKLLAYYPERVWRRKLAQSLHEFSQYAQSNYARMMARGDVLTAQICIGKAIEAAMDIVYILNRTYAPYYKWKKKGMERFVVARQILPLFEEIVRVPVQLQVWEGRTYRSSMVNKDDRCVELFEQIATVLLEELKKQDLVSGNDPFLERYIPQILEGKNVELVEKIIELEWKLFDLVKNEGGRADCQDNFSTFSIMRKSQYLTWPEELLVSFYQDLQKAEQMGWNLIMEKYARMMKTTNPEKYLAFEAKLPVLSEKRVAIQEEIIKIQVAWMESFAEKYPNMAGNARSIRTQEDSEWNTSYETYLRGEMSTYSENTFILYSGFIISLLKEQRNLAKEIMEHTAKLYGYESLEETEKKLN